MMPQQAGQGEPTKQFQHSPDFPDNTVEPSKEQSSTANVSDWGLTEEQNQTVVTSIIQPYRTQWSVNRIEQMPQWLKFAEFDRGRQVLGWDPITRTYFDAIAWNRYNNQDVDYSYLEKYVNNITQMVRRNFVAAMARGVPPVIVQPENAENLADATTAKAAQEAVSIIERNNDIKTQLRYEAQILFLYGVYFKWTRFKIDGCWAGYKEVPEFEEVNAQIGKDHFHCISCGADPEAGEMDMSSPDKMRCPNCSNPLRPQDFMPADFDSITRISGYRRVPNGMVKWSVFGPLQVDTDPTAEHIHEVPLLALEMETDIAELRAIFPGQKSQITAGAESATNPNASYDRLVRTMVYTSNFNVSADIFTERATFTQVWVQPTAYYRLDENNDSLLKMLQQKFPDGMKVSMVGQKVLDIRPAILEKEWTCCKLHEGYGLYPPSVAANVVPFNERFNNVSNILDDYMERCATGITLVDTSRIDVRALSGKSLTGGVLNEVSTKLNGQDKPLEESIRHFAFQLDPGLFNYLDRLMNYCQLISGVPPQVGGTGTMEGVETAKGQKQMLDQALGSLGVIWDNVKTEHARAGQNAIECLQANMQYTGNLWSVIEENGSEYRNNYVHMDEMQGRVRVFPNTDEGLPMSPEQERQWCEQIMELAEKNPAAQAWLDEPTNQEILSQRWGLPGSVIPSSAQRSKTLQDIATLLKTTTLQPMLGPNGQPVMDDDGTPRIRPSVAPNKWVEDYTTLKKTVRQFCSENCDIKGTNPVGWANIIAFYRLALQYESEVQGEQNKLTTTAKMAGAPPSADSDPAIKQLEAHLLGQASDAVDQLHLAAHVPITAKTTAAPVQAAKELTDLAFKVLSTGAK